MSKGVIDKSKYVLNATILNKTIERYLQDLEFLKKRYGIPYRANMSKIAGLMVYAIVKFKPLTLINGGDRLVNNFNANEWLAIYYGLCVCADLGDGNADESGLVSAIISNQFFDEWLRNFKYLLEERSYTAESLVMVFETLGFVFHNTRMAEA